MGDRVSARAAYPVIKIINDEQEHVWARVMGVNTRLPSAT
jgi:hypothetical protein